MKKASELWTFFWWWLLYHGDRNPARLWKENKELERRFNQLKGE